MKGELRLKGSRGVKGLILKMELKGQNRLKILNLFNTFIWLGFGLELLTWRTHVQLS